MIQRNEILSDCYGIICISKSAINLEEKTEVFGH